VLEEEEEDVEEDEPEPEPEAAAVGELLPEEDALLLFLLMNWKSIASVG